MTLKEMKIKILAMIEEYNPDSEFLTDDPDIQAKLNEVINQVMFELARMKKIPKYVEIEVSKGDILDFNDIGAKCGYEVYQLGNLGGVIYAPKANGTVLKIMEDGLLEADVYVYPERITSKTNDNAYEFELSPDALEIMPYGVASDLLKSDVSAEYGAVYSTRYETMISRLDPRSATHSIYFDGGVNI